jgi:solute carrier family 35 protein
MIGIICGPILMIWTFICGDLEKTINFPHLLTPGFMVVLLCSCVLAFVLNYCIFLNTTLNSALTQTICGNMKDLFTVGLGWMLFGGLPFDLVIFFNIPIIPLNLKSASTFATSHYLSFLVHLHR